MKRKQNLFPIALFFLILAVFLYVFPNFFIFRSLNTVLETVTHPIVAPLSSLLSFSEQEEATRLQEENALLFKKLLEFKNIESENRALKDQFQTAYPKNSDLLPAKVTSMPSFIPGVTKPEILIIDKGEEDRVVVGQAVVVHNRLIGKISAVFKKSSKVILTTNNAFSLKAKTVNMQKDIQSFIPAIGLLRGKGNGQMILENVLLSETLQARDVVVSFGDLNENGFGIPPDLIIGTIISVEKKPSALFQIAEVKNITDISHLSTVFVIHAQ